MADGQDTPGTRSAPRRLVMNPTSGRADHAETAHRLAEEHGFPVVETEHGGHGAELARQAVDDGVELLAVCGGDGTLHEVVVGLYERDALDAVTLALVPAGTENFVARELGVTSIEEGFAVATGGSSRRVDLGVAGKEPFVLSAIAGLPADVSAAATHDLKRQFGQLAFVVGAVEEGLSFDGLHVAVDVHAVEGDVGWDGEALAILVGNVRTFATDDGRETFDDGRLEVTIVEETSTLKALVETIEQRLLDEEADAVTTLQATGTDVTGLDGESITYSLDGEIRTYDSVRFDLLPGALEVKDARSVG